MNRLTYRKAVNYVMLTATGLCTVLTVSVLFVILDTWFTTAASPSTGIF
jgi:hypothetical protein